MNSPWPGRLALSFVLAAGVLPQVQPAPGKASAGAATATRATLRVGMWTLWHDRVIKLAPIAHEPLSLTICEHCAAINLSYPVLLRASGESVRLDRAGKSEVVSRIGVLSAASFTAHNDTVTVLYPASIEARNGVLVISMTMPVESYVERVVASESGPDDSLESLKALAIVVRSFALHESHGHASYDLCDSTHCQLMHWGGYPERRPAAHAATLATAGETLWYRGRRALAYFSKDCGGFTASPSEIWPRANATTPYMPSRPDPYCRTSDSRAWASQLTRADLTAALASHGVARLGWQHLAIAERGASGRVSTLRLDSTEIDAEKFRLAVGESLGWNQLPSTWFEVNQQGDRLYFHGRGWGHGVGLCQKGAAVMAAQNRVASQILAQYFPGAQSADEATGLTWQSFSGDGVVLESLDSADAAYLPDFDRARLEAARRSGLNLQGKVTVRAFASTPEFRNSTGAPGWVAAFTEGDWIGIQPLRTLASRHLLAATLRHEFLHALVEHQAGPAAPLWLREGLVEVWSETGANSTATARIKLAALDGFLTGARTESESEAAHRSAAYYADRLIALYGRDKAVEWLRSGIPSEVVAALGQR